MTGRRLRKYLGLCLASALLAGLAGCADTTGIAIPYPNLAAVERIKAKLMSKEEQEAAIEELSLEQEHHRGDAIKAIEKK